MSRRDVAKSRSTGASAEERCLFFEMPCDGPRFVVLTSSCDDLECPALHLGLMELDKEDRPVQGAGPIRASVHADTWRQLSSESRSPAERRVVEAFIADLNDESRAFLREQFDAGKKEARRIASYVMPAEQVLQGTLVSYVDVMTGGHSIYNGGDACSFSVVHAGTTYVIEDLYCPNPECDCGKVDLVFARLQETPAGKVLADCFKATWRLSGTSRIDEVSGCSKGDARAVLSAWRKSDRGLADTFRRRHEQMKDVGKRSLAASGGGQTPIRPPTGSEGKLGRNAPCPCGSGRKYKRCCGRAG